MSAKIVIGVLLILALVRPADAQIYTWRDAKGTLVLSNVPQGGAAPPRSFAVPASSAVRTTVYAPPDRSRQYDGIIRTHAERQGVRPELVRAVVQVESAFNPVAISPKGAMGLMQLMPTTAEELGVGNPFNPEENIRGGVRYLRLLLDRYDNNEQLALAAYNAGPGAVDKYGERSRPTAKRASTSRRLPASSSPSRWLERPSTRSPKSSTAERSSNTPTRSLSRLRASGSRGSRLQAPGSRGFGLQEPGCCF